MNGHFSTIHRDYCRKETSLNLQVSALLILQRGHSVTGLRHSHRPQQTKEHSLHEPIHLPQHLIFGLNLFHAHPHIGCTIDNADRRPESKHNSTIYDAKQMITN